MTSPNDLFPFKKLSIAIIAGLFSVVVTGCSLPLNVDNNNTSKTLSRVDILISQMTLEEKVGMLHGADDPKGGGSAGYIPGVPRLNVPPLHLTDGPAGIRLTGHQATAMPAPVAMAASFSPEIAREMGQVTGAEGKALKQEVLLSPMVNIVRVPQAGRNFETLGEDPLLAGTMVAEQIKGIQEKGLIATVKHFTANNQEQDRFTINANIDERTLNEIYLPAFEAAVDADVGAIMCAYNGVNGDPSCENSMLLTDVLRTRWGFEGFVMSDWEATQSTVNSISNGMDMEMWEGKYFGEPLIAAVKSGEVDEKLVDRSVRRILQQMEKINLFDNQTDVTLDKKANAASAKKIAVAGAVLLKNDASTLPITKSQLAKAAIIGQSAIIPIIGGGGSADVDSFTKVSPLEVFKARTGNDAIEFSQGINLDGSPIRAVNLLADDGSTSGLSMYKGTGESKTLIKVVDDINHVAGEKLPAGSTLTWSGSLNVPSDGVYTVLIQTLGGKGVLKVDGKLVADSSQDFGAYSLLPTQDGLNNSPVTLNLTAGLHSIEIEATAGVFNWFTPPNPKSPLDIRLSWVIPDMRKAEIASAVKAAKKAFVEGAPAIVFAFNEGTENLDRKSLSLPNHQDALISAVAAVNPNTILVLNTGDPVTMPWLDDTAAVLEMWYPGQEGAEATADLLLGKANPSGKLPVTFPKSQDKVPATDPDAYPGVGNQQTYSEGIFVGYRWYDTKGEEPLFPFGYGLSYAEFDYDNTEIIPNDDGGYKVSFTVTNTGDVAGADVPQIYLGAPAMPPVQMAAKSLVGFTKVNLNKGEGKTVTIDIAPRAFKYWSENKHDWVVASGARDVYLGHSATDIQSIGKVSSAK